MDGEYDDPGPDNNLGPSESLDSDDVRNDDGDVVVDPQPLDRGCQASEPSPPEQVESLSSEGKSDAPCTR
jgi:hypothetical protein